MSREVLGEAESCKVTRKRRGEAAIKHSASCLRCQSAAGSGSARVHKKTAGVPLAESELDFQSSLLPGILEHRWETVEFLVINLENLEQMKTEESSLRKASDNDNNLQ